MEITYKSVFIMKRINILTITISALSLLMFSCEKPDLEEGVTYNKGLLNFYIKIPGQTVEYSATEQGPYNDGDTVYVKVPSTEENPLDVTSLLVRASLEHNSVIEPGLHGAYDFTKPLEIKVKDGIGEVRTHYIVVLPTLPKTVFKKLWVKSAAEMALTRCNIKCMAANKNYVFVPEFEDWNVNVGGIYVYDSKTGQKLKTLPTPTTIMSQITCDTEGNLIANRRNSSGAGVVFFRYDAETLDREEIMYFPEGPDNLKDLGTNKMTATGSTKTGKSYIDMIGESRKFYSWEFNDGKAVSLKPKETTYASAKDGWDFATVKRESADSNSDMYIAWTKMGADPSGKDFVEDGGGATFQIFTPQLSDFWTMNKDCYNYKILDFTSFTINGDKFVAMLTQGYLSWDGTNIKVFEVTDKGYLNLIPESADFGKFRVFDSDYFGGTNYNKWGAISVAVDGLEAYIYVAVSGFEDFENSGVRAYKMEYHPQ